MSYFIKLKGILPKKSFNQTLQTSFISVCLLNVLFMPTVNAQDGLSDKRTAIYVSEPQRSALLAEMRGLLIASQQVLEGVVNNDLDSVEKSARKMGFQAAGDVPQEIAKLLPKGFKTLGPQVHRGFEKIADEADGFGDTHKILKILADTQKVCTDCHATYKFSIKRN